MTLGLSLLSGTILAMVLHELGHAIAARVCNVWVSEFGLGVGRRVCRVRLGSLSFSLRAWPVGSFVMLDGEALQQRPPAQQLFVHLGGILMNLLAGALFFGTNVGWLNLLLAAGNLLPLYQHDGWKCGMVIVQSLLNRKSQPAEWAFTFSGGFVSLVIAWLVIRLFV